MKRLLLLILCLGLTACGYKGLGGSFVGSLPDADATAAIASDAADFLASEYAPGHTTIFVPSPEKDAQNGFSTAFEAALRQRGFSVSPESGGNALTVAYTLDDLKGEDGSNGGAWYLHLRISDGQAFARSYLPSGRPEAGRSATTLEKGLGGRLSDKASDTFDAAREAL